MAGRKASVYFSENTNKFCNNLTAKTKTSLSDVIADAIRESVIQKHVGVRISEGAYLCFAANRLDLLNVFKFEDGVTVICAKEDAFKLKNGERGPLAEEQRDLIAYLGAEVDEETVSEA